MSKIYTVVKDGETVKELKTLAAAKKLGDAEGGEVLCEGECVYQGAVATAVPAEEEKMEAPAAEKYTLTCKMNVRKAPSLKAEKLTVLDAGAVVDVLDIQNDWLHLTDGSFILYENGKNAKKN
ncbi:MAG: SH3 domain-containing protein [Syntrophales bacterium]|jgi:hypothetical protein|nr:SH3 domain-containing protein [Syntrophales bacterium]